MNPAVFRSILSASFLTVSHVICVYYVYHNDLVTGNWSKYALNKKRTVTKKNYVDGLKNFSLDVVFLLIPCLIFCFQHSGEAISKCTDSLLVSIGKLIIGYVGGKFWAFGVHYLLHKPWLYAIHRAHHLNTKVLVASAAWKDSFAEYAIMELPSFALGILLLPTHLYIHLIHFVFHGYDGAAGHSGFAGMPGFNSMFDGEYHYHHHSRLTVNYAELEFLDKMCGTHHSQLEIHMFNLKIQNFNKWICSLVWNDNIMETMTTADIFAGSKKDK